MSTPRSTAVLEINLPSSAIAESLPLTSEREFNVCLRINDAQRPAGLFRSPMNDAQWRDYTRWLSQCNTERDAKNYQLALILRNFGRDLYLSLTALSPDLAAFLNQSGVPRRLVIQTTRPELHQLPWASMYDPNGLLLAAGDLSIVQNWGPDFSGYAFQADEPRVFGSTVNLVSQIDPNTPQSTFPALHGLPPEITRNAAPRDILHLEKHGDAEQDKIGGTVAQKLASDCKDTGIALLWSCFSSSANSWGESPALALHRQNTGLVLSFQVELHIDDATQISRDFYGEVFGPAATRDPESALVSIRAAAFAQNFEYANWASMTVYLRQPLDMSALPLNGPRVPKKQWTDDVPAAPDQATADAWASIADAVKGLQPGSPPTIVDASALGAKFDLPRTIFSVWRGNVIRLDGDSSLQPPETSLLDGLNIPWKELQGSSTPDRLAWFFKRIGHFGSPLIVWTHAQPRHLEFLRTVAPDSNLTFLLLYGSEPQPTVASLTEENRLTEAIKLFETAAATNAVDPEASSYAYFAYCRSGSAPEMAAACIRSLGDSFESLLLSGNFVSRFGREPLSAETGSASDPTPSLQNRHIEEDFYRRAIDAATGDSLLRDRGRARHELAYFMQCQGRIGTAEILYRLSLQDLDRCTTPDARWLSALGNTLRDWADLLATDAGRSAEAHALLERALALNAFYGRNLQTAYSLATRAQLNLSTGMFDAAITDALDSANLFETCENWRGWLTSIAIMLKAFSATRESALMLAVIAMVRRKLPAIKREAFEHTLTFEQAHAFWLKGDLTAAGSILNALKREAPPAFFTETITGVKAARLLNFLQLDQPDADTSSRQEA